MRVGPRPPLSAPDAAGHFSIAPYGLAGSVADIITASGSSGAPAARAAGRAPPAARTAWRPGRSRSSRAGSARVLHGLQHVVDRAEAAADRLGGRHLARDHAVAREQLLRGRGGALGRRDGRAMRSSTSDQRPPAAGGGDAPGAEGAAARRLAWPASRRAGEGAQRVEGVVGDEPVQTRSQSASTVRPGSRRPRASCSAAKNDAPSLAAGARRCACSPSRAARPAVPGRQQPGEVIGEVQRDAPVALAERLDADPDHLAGGDERVEIGGVVVLDPRRQDLASRAATPAAARPAAARSRRAARRARARAARRPASAVRNRAEHAGSTGSTSLAQLRERRRRSGRSTSASHHSRSGAAGPELALEQAARRRERARACAPRSARPRPKRAATRVGGERPVRARVAQRQVAERSAHRLQQRLRQARRQRHAERVAVARRVLDGDEPRLAGDVHRTIARRAPTSAPRSPRLAVDAVRAAISPAREIAEAQQQVVHARRRVRAW